METVTFFSYKGGAGRSSTALNTLPYLVDVLGADKNSPILLLDMDLDSAGMTYLLGLDKHFQDGTYDIKDFLTGAENWSSKKAEKLEEHTLYKNFFPVGKKLGVENEAIMFLGVDDRKKIDNSDMAGAEEQVFDSFDNFCYNNNIKAVVIDSAAGEQPVAVLSIKAASTVVNCMRVTTQFRIGTFNFLERYKENKRNIRIILLPTVVPEDREIDGEMQLHNTVDDIIERIKDKKLENVNTDFINEAEFGINEVARFKWREDVLYKIAKTQSLTNDEEIAAARYKKLALTISKGKKNA
jgi:cellulose biosynthesis protein BcsQ